MQSCLPQKWPRTESPKPHTQPSVETTLPLRPSLTQLRVKMNEKKNNQRKGKSPKQVYSSFNKFYLEYLISQEFSAFAQRSELLQLCPVD